MADAEAEIVSTSEEAEKTDTEETESVEVVATEEADTTEEIVVGAAESVSMYRLYNENSGEHFYTKAKGEAVHLRNIGWHYEGIGWYAPSSSSMPVYRLYNPNAGDHHYTTNQTERDFLVKVGWNDEGIGWYSADAASSPVYRQYNPNAKAGAHNFTTNAAEDKMLGSVGWKREGIGWYAAAAGRGKQISDLGATTYYKGQNLSEIYSYEEYTALYPDVVKEYGIDDEKIIENFVKKGLKEGRVGKSDYNKTLYEEVKKKYAKDFPKARAVLNQIGHDLRAAFNWSNVPYYGRNGELPRTPDYSSEWWADFGYQYHKGNCYVRGALFYQLATELGYEARQVYGAVYGKTGLSRHSWVELKINGQWYVFDPGYKNGSQDGYKITYGQKGTWKYVIYGYMD